MMSGKLLHRQFKTWPLLAVLGLMAHNNRASAKLAITGEQEWKVAALYHFAKYVSWPETTLGDGADPLVFAILGTDPFGKVFEDQLAEKLFDGRPIRLKRYSTVEEIDTCHVLYISPSECSRLHPILHELCQRPILTLSEIPGFARHGGILEVAVNRQPSGILKPAFHINLYAAKLAGLNISSRLLDLARSIPGTHASPLDSVLKYVQWPGADGQAEFFIGVAGTGPYVDDLPGRLEGKSIRGAVARVIQYGYANGNPPVRMLFVGASFEGRLAEFLLGVGNRSILTISTIPGFAQQGGMIEIDLQDKIYPMVINLTAINRAGMIVGPGIPRCARIIQ